MSFDFGDVTFVELSQERINIEEAIFKLLNILQTKWEVNSFDWLYFKYEKLVKEIEEFKVFSSSFGLYDFDYQYDEIKNVFRQYWRAVEFFQNEVYIFLDDYDFGLKTLHLR
jgi:hypothetical protein